MTNCLRLLLCTTLAAARVANAQAPAGAATPAPNSFAALAPTGVTCLDTPVSNDMKRRGVWQLLQLTSKTPTRMIALGLDAKHRPRILSSDMSTAQFDSSGGVTGRVLSVGSPSRELTVAERAAARKLALDAKRRCSPLKPITDAARPVPPAAHTGVLADIEVNEPTCHSNQISDSDKQNGVSRRVMYTVKQPFRTFFVTADAKGEPLAFSANVIWGAESPVERESADVAFNPDGTAVTSSIFLGYGGPDGKGAKYKLNSDEKVKALTLSKEILKHCENK